MNDEISIIAQFLESLGTETTIVYVAAFDDGWDFYVECGLSLGVRGDERLIDEIVEVCRATVPVGE